LHESNTIPGRANRWLSWLVDRAFVGFPQAAEPLHTRQVTVTGTPVRSQFQALDPQACRAALGFDPARPLVLVMGGSQGASGINELIGRALPDLAARAAHWQWLHLAGPNDADKLRHAYRQLQLAAIVHPFLETMELALGAATAAISRAGASSVAELAAMRVPPLLIPFPAATDNHQFHNARALEASGAARLLEQRAASPEQVVAALLELMEDRVKRERMQEALALWHQPHAARQIAQAMLATLVRPEPSGVARSAPGAGSLHRHPSLSA
jgi:UDP-N-acetylglucosamine--N-acetylmuramyl-(pentapeptide) pyrophosphoryl-undecaprenol N-acetylglucosamine transferase